MSAAKPGSQSVNETAENYSTEDKVSVDTAVMDVDIVEQKLAEDAQKEDFTGIESAHSGQLLKMSMTLSVNEGFMLIFAEYNNLQYQTKVIDWLGKKDLQQAVLDCEDIPDYPSVEEKLFQLAKNHKVIHITGTHRWFSKTATENWADRLNYRRERIAENAPVTIVLWLFGSQLTDLAKQATDFWSWRTSIFEFNNVPESKGMEVKFEGWKVREIDEDETNKRIAELNGYIDGLLNPSLADADLYIELAELYIDCSKYDDAATALNCALSIVSISDDIRRYAKGQLVKAELHFKSSQYKEAESILEKEVIPPLTQLMDDVKLAEAYYLKAEILRKTKSYNRSIELLENRAIPVFEREQNTFMLEYCFLCKVECHFSLKSADELVELVAKRWISCIEKYGENSLSIIPYILNASYLFLKGEYQTAINIFEGHINPLLADAENLDELSANLLHLYSRGLAQTGRWKDAIQILEHKCLPFFRKQKKHQDLTTVSLELVSYLCILDISLCRKPRKKTLEKASKILNELYRTVKKEDANIEWQIQIEDAADEHDIKLHLRTGKGPKKSTKAQKTKNAPPLKKKNLPGLTSTPDLQTTASALINTKSD